MDVTWAHHTGSTQPVHGTGRNSYDRGGQSGHTEPCAHELWYLQMQRKKCPRNRFQIDILTSCLNYFNNHLYSEYLTSVVRKGFFSIRFEYIVSDEADLKLVD